MSYGLAKDVMDALIPWEIGYFSFLIKAGGIVMALGVVGYFYLDAKGFI